MTKLSSLIFLLLFPAAVCAEDASFLHWLASFSSVAEEHGITAATWRNAFAGITGPDLVVLEKAARQPEFTSEIWDYLDTRVNGMKAAEGQRQWRLHASTLAAVSRRFGVEPAILLAIWLPPCSMSNPFAAHIDRPAHPTESPR